MRALIASEAKEVSAGCGYDHYDSNGLLLLFGPCDEHELAANSSPSTYKPPRRRPGQMEP
jgi:hypothetical protein